MWEFLSLTHRSVTNLIITSSSSIDGYSGILEIKTKEKIEIYVVVSNIK